MVATFFKYLLSGLLALLCLLVAYLVFARYLPFVPDFLWTEEIARTVFMWMIMIGAGYGFVEGTHFSFSFLLNKAEGAGGYALRVLVALIVVALAVFFVWSGWIFFLKGFKRSSLVTGLPMATSYGALLVGAGIMTLATFAGLIRALRGDKPKTDIEGL